jgi:hypothetical protein
MRTGQALFLLGIEPGIPRIRPWKELLATGAQATWLTTLTALLTTKVQVINQLFYIVKVVNEIHVKKVITLHFCVNENVV